MNCRMDAATFILIGLIVLSSPHIAREVRRIVVSIASELKAAKDELAALKAQVAQPQPLDLSPLSAEIAALSAKVDAVASLVGTPEELNPPA